ncbi:hypothetical protein J6590_050504 [Homalodisca vitripennis]|nr:hypothetical protein J6590_050504 [Homalodisca vitripennis]
MKRANSPLSDNTISRVINEEENFSSDESFLNNFGSEVDSSFSEVDDTDNDPTYDPDQPGPSSNILPIVSRPRILSESESESSIDGENVRSRLTTIHQQPRQPSRPRPRHTNGNSTDDSSGENNEGWIDVTAENDPGYSHSFSFL